MGKRIVSFVAFIVLSIQIGFCNELHEAVKKGDLTEVAVLLKSNIKLEEHDDSGLTALHWAAWKGHTAIAEVLIQNGADVESKTSTSEESPLDLAKEAGNKDMIKLLKEYGALIDKKNFSVAVNPLALGVGGLLSSFLFHIESDFFINENISLLFKLGILNMDPDSWVFASGVQQKSIAPNFGVRFYLSKDYEGFMLGAQGSYERIVVSYNDKEDIYRLIGIFVESGYRWNLNAFTVYPVFRIGAYPNSPGRVLLEETKGIEYYADLPVVSFGFGVLIGFVL